MKMLLKLTLVLIVLVVLAFIYTNYKFQQTVNDRVREMYKDLPPVSGKTITEADLEHLPPLMQSYLKDTGLVGMPYINKVKLNQVGKIRLQPDGKWLNFTAEQYYRLDKPAFIWNTTVKILGIPIIRGMDIYEEGKGYMKIKVLPFFTVVDATGPEVNTGAHSRYMNEVMWFPQMYLSDQMSFSQKNSDIVEVTFEDKGITTVADLEIKGDKILNFTCDRWYGNDPGHITRRWSTPINEWEELSGLMLPVGGHAEWDLDGSVFEYIQIKITDIEYE